jgi:hypothetical protein
LLITLFVLLILLILGVNFMKKSLFRVIAAVAVLTPAISANAALFNYNEQFDSNNGVHFNLNFTANNTGITEITSFNGTAGTDVLTLIAPGGFPAMDPNDNLFDPSTLATSGGWSFYGVSFHGTASGYDFNLYLDQDNSLYLLTDMPQAVGNPTNYSYSASPVSSVPVPAAVWLFASGLGLLTFGRRKNIA